MPEDLRAKADASDLVQQTFLEAQLDFSQFQGWTEEELLSWLRRLLLNNLTDFSRKHRDSAKREVDREVAIDHECGTLEDCWESPCSAAETREEEANLHRALNQLPPHYRQVIQWHSLDERSFVEIGDQLERSAEAVRKLWCRAVAQLRGLLVPGIHGQGEAAV